MPVFPIYFEILRKYFILWVRGWIAPFPRATSWMTELIRRLHDFKFQTIFLEICWSVKLKLSQTVWVRSTKCYWISVPISSHAFNNLLYIIPLDSDLPSAELYSPFSSEARRHGWFGARERARSGREGWAEVNKGNIIIYISSSV